jgi:hypothetical protein
VNLPPAIAKTLWFVAAVAIAWGLNGWRATAALDALQDAREGDRAAAEDWIDRTLEATECELHEAESYLSSSSSRPYVHRPDYVETFVEKLYDHGASGIEICDSHSLGYLLAHYLLVWLPDDESQHEQLIADAQSMARRDAVVYHGATSAEAEEIVRTSTLIGERRVLLNLPVEAE